MSRPPQVSLLIPTHNSGDTVADAIDSCCSQTFEDVEILIYDEASRDHTREILNQKAALDRRIRLLTSETNSGPVRAWRRLLHEARGKYSTFVWADDLILPEYVEKLANVLDQNPNQCVTGCNAYTEMLPGTAGEDRSSVVTGIQSRRLLHDFPTVKVKGDELALGILAGVFPVSQICYLFDTQVARDVFDHYIDFENPYDFDFSRRAYGNDVSFASELALRSGEIIMIGDPLVSCRASPDSMTVNARRHHRWQYWLQYVWAIRSAWTRCRHMSPRMDALIRVADDRVSFCDTFYSARKRQWPREFNPVKFCRAAFFLLRHDRRTSSKVSPATVQSWIEKHAGPRR